MRWKVPPVVAAEGAAAAALAADWRLLSWFPGSSRRRNRAGTDADVEAAVVEGVATAELLVLGVPVTFAAGVVEGTGFGGGVLLGGAATNTISNSPAPLAVGTASVQAVLLPVVASWRAEISIAGISASGEPAPGMPMSLNSTPWVSVEKTHTAPI